MTNTERGSAVKLDELDELPPWDDAETLDRLAAQLTAADARSLAIYGLDSDNQTLVGLGPVARARRSREAAESSAAAERSAAAEKPDSERMPQSEPPGPFIAAEADELQPFLRRRKLGGWAVAAPAVLLVAAAAFILGRKPAPDSPPATKFSHAIVAPQLPARAASEPAPLEEQLPGSLGAAEEHAAESAPMPATTTTPTPTPTSDESAPRSQRSQASATVSGGVVAVPVKLPELSSPVVVDRAGDNEHQVGTINVTSNPPANVVLDGRPVGKAPRIVRVPAGTHKLVFIHPLYGRRSLSVNVSPGVTTGASAEF